MKKEEKPMSRKIAIILSAIFLIVLLCGGLVGATIYINDLPNRVSNHETILYGQNKLVPGSQAGIRVVVRDTTNTEPIEGAQIAALLQPASGGEAIQVFSGLTDSSGSTDVNFTVPEDAESNQTLIIQTSSELGSDEIRRSVIVSREYRVLLTTDKPIYQPGQIIHIRALALSTFDLVPAKEQDLEITIADGKGNKVFRKTLTTSEWGVTATDFQLANEVNTGNYKITASMEDVSSEKTVTVEHYVLPKFNIGLSTEKRFYAPGDVVNGSISANYFFGKPVSEANVEIQGYTFDFERTITFTLEGITDNQGNFDFTFTMPEYIVGTDLEGGLGRFYIEARVTDQAEHTESANMSLPVSGNPILIEAIPEAGQFRPNIENILYVLTSYPDGTPIETELTIDLLVEGRRITAKTGSYGIAEVPVTLESPYQEIQITAKDNTGAVGERYFYFEGDWQEAPILLRPDRPAYKVGETMLLEIFSTNTSGTAYLDIVRAGQIVSTRSVKLENGQAQIAVDLTPDLYGTLELHAYKILSWGGITRDTRLVIVDNANDLDFSISAGADTYLPGDEAALDIQVLSNDGVGVQAAVGLAIVDESVFALAQQDPGFAKLYFMLEAELLQPKYELHGFSVPDLIQDPQFEDQDLESATQSAAQASLAAAVPVDYYFSMQANSHDDAMQEAYSRQEKYYGSLSIAIFSVSLIIPLIVVGINMVSIWQEKRFGRSILTALGLILAPTSFIYILLLIWPHPWAQTPGEKLSEFFYWLAWQGQILIGCVLGIGLIGLIAVLIIAIVQKDKTLGWTLGLSPVFIFLLIIAGFATSAADFYPASWALILGLIAFLLLPFALITRSTFYAYQKNILASIILLAVGVTMPLASIIGIAGLADRAIPIMGAAAPQIEFMEAEEAGEWDMALEAAPAEEMERSDKADSGLSQTSATEAPRLRQYFPETMLWLPEEITDPDGSLNLNFPVADSITTWRVSALASSQDGRLGSTTTPLVVFQDFFVDLDLPLSLTVGDEISVPVGVFNYLEVDQTVRIEIEEQDWFELLDEVEKEIQIRANDITVVYFRIKAIDFGTQPFQVTAWGTEMSDAILKNVRVFPDGKQIFYSYSDRLNIDEEVNQKIDIPIDTIAGTQSLLVKIYPGVVSQVVEGLDSILRMPNGCFEQTSSSTYPNVLVLDYLQLTNQASPEVEFKAEEYINLGYQRLITFEVNSDPGGFSLFGDAPADPMLTAYGLQEFNDMSRVHNVDSALIERTANWLFSHQNSDGSWQGVQGFHESGLTNQTERLPVTAYVVWGLSDAGFATSPSTTQGAAYLKEYQSQVNDPYTLALVANALVSYDLAADNQLSSTTLSVIDRIAEMASQDNNVVFWTTENETVMGSYGDTSSLETTALVALAFLRAEVHPELANGALTFLVQNKDSFGTWTTTQATIMALKAMIQSVRAGAENVNASVTIALNGAQAHSLEVTPENFDVVQMVSFDDVNIGRENIVSIRVEGEGNLMYQVSGSYYLPWQELTKYPEAFEYQDIVTIDVEYDRTELAVNDTVNVQVTVNLNSEGSADSALIDLGIPPGFSVETSDLSALVAQFDDIPEDYGFATIERYELTGRQIIIYVSNLNNKAPLEFSYRLRAKYPLVAQTPASNAYDYYNPDISGLSTPQTLTVLKAE
jgi:uncharacterized protein YfaS (alpha-2-macroglobulin family)